MAIHEEVHVEGRVVSVTLEWKSALLRVFEDHQRE